MSTISLTKRIATVLLTASLITACDKVEVVTNNDNITRISDLSDAQLAKLTQKSYYFGHQSVGVNMVDGLNLLIAEHPALKLNIENSEDHALLKPGSFLHSRVGKNRQPETKIAAFENVLDNGVGNLADIASLKYCYVDANVSVDPNQLFNTYKERIEKLKTKYPKTTFVHFTLPLKAIPTDFKTQLKGLLGTVPQIQMDNVTRGEYNDLLRKNYEGKDPIFDIAYFESITANTKKRHIFTADGKRYETLAPENTNDGGHLSDTGKRWIAEQFVVFLAKLE